MQYELKLVGITESGAYNLFNSQHIKWEVVHKSRSVHHHSRSMHHNDRSKNQNYCSMHKNGRSIHKNAYTFHAIMPPKIEKWNAGEQVLGYPKSWNGRRMERSSFPWSVPTFRNGNIWKFHFNFQGSLKVGTFRHSIFPWSRILGNVQQHKCGPISVVPCQIRITEKIT